MPYLNKQSSHCCHRKGTVRSPAPLSYQEQNDSLVAGNQALAFVIEADYNSIWPTHRIRSFVLSQPPEHFSFGRS